MEIRYVSAYRKRESPPRSLQNGARLLFQNINIAFTVQENEAEGSARDLFVEWEGGREACRNSLAVCNCSLNSCVHMLINSACLHSDLVATCVASSLSSTPVSLVSPQLLSSLPADVWFSSQPPLPDLTLNIIY